MAKRALITGSHGFLGSHLARHLRQHDIEVFPFKREWFTDPNLEGYIKSIDPHYIFHLAASGNLPGHKEDDVDVFTSNLGYLFNLLQAVKDLPLEGFINISTSSVLLPFQTTYSATKMGAEALCKSYADQYAIPAVSMRPFSLYGPGDHPGHLIPTLFNAALTDKPIKIAKDPMHDWTYVEDFVEVMIAYAKAGKAHQGKSVHVGSGRVNSNWMVLQDIEEITGKRIKINGEFPARAYDTDEWVARSSLGNVEFTPTTLTQGLQKVFKSLILD